MKAIIPKQLVPVPLVVISTTGKLTKEIRKLYR